MKLPHNRYGRRLSYSDYIYNFFATLTGLTVFSWEFFKQAFIPPYEIGEVKKHMDELGVKTLGIVSVTGFIIGLVLAMQSQPVMQRFGASDFLPGMVSLSVVRELGPVITALIFAGRVSSGIGAELGSMRVTEQIDAMEVSGTRPFSFLVVTRVMATTLMLPILVVYADVIALLGSFLTVHFYNNASFTLYFNEVSVSVSFLDVFSSLIKSAFFGFAIGLISCYAGYTTSGGTSGVGKAANTAVVVSMIFIFVIDLVSLQFINLFR